MKRIATALALLAALPALAQTPGYQGSDGIGREAQGVVTIGFRYQLLGTLGGLGATASGVGAAVGPVLPGSYVFACTGTIGGGTVALQVIGPSGSFDAVAGASFTSLPGSITVLMPRTIGYGPGTVTAPNARATITGATSPSVWCSLS